MKTNDSYKVNIMTNNKTSSRLLAAGFFGNQYHPRTVYKDLAPAVAEISKQEKTTLTETKRPAEPLRGEGMQSLLETCLQPQSPLAIFKKD